MGTKEWVVVEYDLARMAQANRKFQRIVLPKELKAQVVLKVDDTVYKKIEHDGVLLARMHDQVNTKIKGKIDDLVNELKVAEGNVGAPGFDVKKFQAKLANDMNAASKLAAAECQKFWDEMKKRQAEYKSFKFVAVGKIVLGTITTAGGVAVSVLSFGTLTPLAGVAAARGVIEIGNEIVALSVTADQQAKVVNGQLKALWEIMKSDNPDVKDRVLNGIKEAALQSISKILALKFIPSIANCGEHIETHGAATTKMENKSLGLSKKIAAVMDHQNQWSRQFHDAVHKQQNAVKADPKLAQKIQQLDQALKKSETVLEKVLARTEKVTAGVIRALERQEAYEHAIADLEKGRPEWAKWVPVAVGFGFDLALGSSGEGEALEKSLDALVDVEKLSLEVLEMASKKKR